MMKIIIFILIVGINIMSQNNEFSNKLYQTYESYKENSLSKKRFKHSDILPLIKQLEKSNLFSVSLLGTSVEDREIFLVKAGNGKTKVFLWSQMHGDEPTATMALFDIFNFLNSSDEFDEIRNLLFNNLTLFFIPMVNPDGAEKFQRRNSFGIDINRDAVQLATPEARILMNTQDSLSPHFGFNLHDQGTRYSAGQSSRSASISFLAPPYNYEKEFNSVRTNAVKVISIMTDALNQFIPGHIAKYKDDFEPRAFGDNFQKKGMSTILIESGGWKGDTDKQFLRKLNFIIILTALKSIAEKSYENADVALYDNLPFNENYLYDLVLRNVKHINSKDTIKIDLGINNLEFGFGSSSLFSSYIDFIGDLSPFYGYEDIDFDGRIVLPGKIYPETLSKSDIDTLNYFNLLKEGHLFIKISDNNIDENFYCPLNVLLPSKYDYSPKVGLSQRANFIIINGEKIEYVVLNGILINTNFNPSSFNKGIIIR